MIVPLVIRLRLPVDPSAITRLVISVRVNTVDCKRFAVSVRYRPSVEIYKAIPFVAYPYPSCSVELVIMVVLAITTGFNAAPYVVQPCMSVSVFSIRSVLIDYHSLAPSR